MDGDFVKHMAITKMHAIVGWGLCGLVMYAGMATTTTANAIIIHLIAAPVVFWALSTLYFKRFDYFSPLHTAAILVAVVISLDVIIVALIIEKSFDMFRSPMGTWIVFGLIFVVTWLTGIQIRRQKRARTLGP
jgi:hypothetical protein